MTDYLAIDPEQAYDLAGAIRDAIGSYYDNEISVDLPERRLVFPGLPAYDCEQLTVHAERIVPVGGDISQEATPDEHDPVGFYMRAVEYGVTILRCVPVPAAVGQVTNPDDEELAAAAILRDPVHVWNGIISAMRSGELPGCGGVRWRSWEALSPQSDLGGGMLRLLVSLE